MSDDWTLDFDAQCEKDGTPVNNKPKTSTMEGSEENKTVGGGFGGTVGGGFGAKKNNAPPPQTSFGATTGNRMGPGSTFNPVPDSRGAPIGSTQFEEEGNIISVIDHNKPKHQFTFNRSNNSNFARNFGGGMGARTTSGRFGSHATKLPDSPVGITTGGGFGKKYSRAPDNLTADNEVEEKKEQSAGGRFGMSPIVASPATPYSPDSAKSTSSSQKFTFKNVCTYDPIPSNVGGGFGSLGGSASKISSSGSTIGGGFGSRNPVSASSSSSSLGGSALDNPPGFQSKFGNQLNKRETMTQRVSNMRKEEENVRPSVQSDTGRSFSTFGSLKSSGLGSSNYFANKSQSNDIGQDSRFSEDDKFKSGGGGFGNSSTVLKGFAAPSGGFAQNYQAARLSTSNKGSDGVTPVASTTLGGSFGSLKPHNTGIDEMKVGEVKPSHWQMRSGSDSSFSGSKTGGSFGGFRATSFGSPRTPREDESSKENQKIEMNDQKSSFGGMKSGGSFGGFRSSGLSGSKTPDVESSDGKTSEKERSLGFGQYVAGKTNTHDIEAPKTSIEQRSFNSSRSTGSFGRVEPIRNGFGTSVPTQESSSYKSSNSENFESFGSSTDSSRSKFNAVSRYSQDDTSKYEKPMQTRTTFGGNRFYEAPTIHYEKERNDSELSFEKLPTKINSDDQGAFMNNPGIGRGMGRGGYRGGMEHGQGQFAATRGRGAAVMSGRGGYQGGYQGAQQVPTNDYGQQHSVQPSYAPITPTTKADARFKYVAPKLAEIDNHEQTPAPAEIALLNKYIHQEVNMMKNAHVDIQRSDPTSPLYSISSFRDLRLKPEVLRALDTLGFEFPTRIQETALPLLLMEPPSNLIAQAQSGTGKTAAFVLTMLSRIDVSLNCPQCICLAPTLELAKQIGEVVEKMGVYIENLKIHYAIKGANMAVMRGRKITDHIVIGTPGVTHDYLVKYGCIDPSQIRCLVLDEADVMIYQQGFTDISTSIYNLIEDNSENVQSMLFSATYDTPVIEFATKLVKNAIVVMLKREEQALPNIKQFYVKCDSRDAKYAAIVHLYSSLTVASTVIFCHTKASVMWLYENMKMRGHSVNVLHGDMTVTERADTIIHFKKGDFRVLITTNVFARGIDVAQVSIVINYDLPIKYDANSKPVVENGLTQPDCETYLHRIGRTGRFGKTGIAINFIDSNESMNMINVLENHFQMKIACMDPSNLVELEAIEIA